MINRNVFLNIINQYDVNHIFQQAEKERLMDLVEVLQMDVNSKMSFVDAAIFSSWTEMLEMNHQVTPSSLPFFECTQSKFKIAFKKTLHSFINLYLDHHSPLNTITGLYHLLLSMPLTRLLPHYKIIESIFKNLGGNENPLVSVLLTFALSDIIFHQLPVLLQKYLIEGQSVHEDFENDLKEGVREVFYWTLISIPSIHYKYSQLLERRASEHHTLSKITIV